MLLFRFSCLAVVLALACCGLFAASSARAAGPTSRTAAGTPTAEAGGAVQPAKLVSQPRMRRCLRAKGAALSRVPRTTKSMALLHDLAQRTSFLARIRRSEVGVGVMPSVANAQLLVELLFVPNSGYRIHRRGNVVFLSRASGRKALRVALGCAR